VAVDPVVWWSVMLFITPIERLCLLDWKIGMLADVDVIATDEATVDVSVETEWRLFLRQLPLTVSPLDAANNYHHKRAYIKYTQMINMK